MSKISVYIKEPGRAPYHTNISNTLTNMQRTVDGYIETVRVRGNLIMVCDEEGRLKGKEVNFYLNGEPIVGTVFFCGNAGEEFADVPLEWKSFRMAFPEFWKSDLGFGKLVSVCL